MGSKKDPPTIGYRYYLGMHQVYGVSPVAAPFTALKKIKVGEVEVWSGNVTSNSTITINKPEAFGGDAKEGGVAGPVDVMFGGLAQGLNTYLSGVLSGNPVPYYRGLFSLVLNRVQVSAMNPYIKPWSAYLSRINGGFYPAKATIGEDMNPAHIIYEMLSSYEFGIGIPVGDIDLTSFTTAADTLYTEGFGLSIFWDGEESAEEFIDYILEHIDGVLFLNPSTGKFTLKLARDDFNSATLVTLDPTNILSVDRYAQPMPGELTSVVQIKFEDRVTGESGSVTEHDIAVVEMQGGYSVVASKNYRGIPTADLATKVAYRELRALSTPLARAEIVANREAWGLSVGAPFKFQWPSLGIEEMIMRVASIDYGTLTSGRVVIEAVQDVFKVASTLISNPTALGWFSPLSDPAPCPNIALIEIPYYILMREVFAESTSVYNDYGPDATTVVTLGDRPSDDSYNYKIYSTVHGSTDYTSTCWGDFCPTAVLTSAVVRELSSTFQVNSWKDMDEVVLNSWAYLNDEVVKVTAITATTVTVQRGAMDTVPGEHPIGTVIFFGGTGHGIDEKEWSNGSSLRYKLCPRTGRGVYPEASIGVGTLISLTSRQKKPYPPGNLRLNSVSYPASVAGDITLAFNSRNRLLQTASIPVQSDGSVTPETGTEYHIVIYGTKVGGSALRTVTTTSLSYVYTVAQATIDNGGTKPTQIRFQVYTRRIADDAWSHYTNVIAADWS